MDADRVIQLLEEIRALQRQQVDAQQQALGVVIAVVLVMALVLLRYVIQRYS